MKFYAQIKDGHLKLDDQQIYLDYVRSHAEGKRFIIDIKERSQDRSLNQNAYKWGVIVQILIDEGIFDDKEECNSWLRLKFNSKVVEVMDEKFIVGIPFSNLTTKEFEEKMENIRRFFAKEGINIPEPNEEKLYELERHRGRLQSNDNS